MRLLVARLKLGLFITMLVLRLGLSTKKLRLRLRPLGARPRLRRIKESEPAPFSGVGY